MMEGARMQQWNKGPRPKGAATSEEGEGIFKKTIELKVAKQIVRSSSRLRKMDERTLWRAWPPPK
jgi:hypothetical protein